MATSDNFQRLLYPGLRKIFFDTYTEKAEEYSKIYHINTSKKATEEDHHVSGLGMWEEKKRSENISYEDIQDGLSVFYRHKAYAKGIQVERELYDDDQYSVINKLPKTIARGGRATVETLSAQVLNEGFNTAGYDGVPLFSSSHPLIKGGTGDNVLDRVLSPQGIQEGLLLMSQQTDEAGLKIQSKADKLIIPEELEWTAYRILQSAQLPGTVFNDKNPAKGLAGLKVIIMSYLSSTRAWFLQDSSLHEMTFFWRVKPEFAQKSEFDNMVAKYRGYLRFSVGYSNWRGMIGSDGSVATDWPESPWQQEGDPKEVYVGYEATGAITAVTNGVEYDSDAQVFIVPAVVNMFTFKDVATDKIASKSGDAWSIVTDA